MKLARAVLFATALVATAPVVIPQAPTVRAPAAVATDIKAETGIIDGATYRIDMPTKWNGGVVVMNHGCSPEPRIPAAGAPSARLRVFPDRGFAVAQSSYSRGG